MATYTKLYTIDFTAVGDTVYSGVDKLEDNIDRIISNLNSCHTSNRGEMIYRGASQVEALSPPDTAGSILTHDGDGSDPAWSSSVTVNTSGDVSITRYVLRNKKSIAVYGDSLNTAVDQIGTSSVTLVVDTSVTLTTSIASVPSNISVEWIHPGKIVFGNYNITTWSAPFANDPLWQIFDYTGTGTVSFGDGAVMCVRPEWFGAKPDDASIDCLSALDDAFAALKAQMTLLLNGMYYVSDSLTISQRKSLLVRGAAQAELNYFTACGFRSKAGFGGTEILKLDNCTHIKFENLNIYAYDGTSYYDGVVVTGTNNPASHFIQFETLDVIRADEAFVIGNNVGGTHYQFQNCAVRNFRFQEIQNTGVHIKSTNVDQLVLDNGVIRTLNANGKAIHAENSGLIDCRSLVFNGNNATSATGLYLTDSAGNITLADCASENEAYYCYDAGTGTPDYSVVHVDCIIGEPYYIAGNRTHLMVGGRLAATVTEAGANGFFATLGANLVTGAAITKSGSAASSVQLAQNLAASTVKDSGLIQQYLTLQPRSAAPTLPGNADYKNGTLTFADVTNWDPVGKGSGDAYPVVYPASSWIGLLGVKKMGTFTWDPPSLADGEGANTTVSVSGVAFGDIILVAAPYSTQSTIVTAWVVSAGTIGVRVQNESGSTVDLASGDWTYYVLGI